MIIDPLATNIVFKKGCCRVNSNNSKRLIRNIETLLHDNSYVTKESFVYLLAMNFPEDREKVISNKESLLGNNDKSLQIDMVKTTYETPEFDAKKLYYYLELLAFASAQFESSIGQNALETLLSIDFYEYKVITQLFLATKHHKWQFTLLQEQRFEIT